MTDFLSVGHALAMPWPCLGHALAMPWPCLVAFKLPKRGTVFKIHEITWRNAGVRAAHVQQQLRRWTDLLSLFGKGLEVLVLHAGAIWYYHGFLRDILMARHVTSMSVSRTPKAML